jgi:hypothetical protein
MASGKEKGGKYKGAEGDVLVTRHHHGDHADAFCSDEQQPGNASALLCEFSGEGEERWCEEMSEWGAVFIGRGGGSRLRRAVATANGGARVVASAKGGAVADVGAVREGDVRGLASAEGGHRRGRGDGSSGREVPGVRVCFGHDGLG